MDEIAHQRAVFLNLFLARDTLGQLLQYLAATLFSKIGQNTNKSASWRHPAMTLSHGTLVCRRTLVENHCQRVFGIKLKIYAEFQLCDVMSRADSISDMSVTKSKADLTRTEIARTSGKHKV